MENFKQQVNKSFIKLKLKRKFGSWVTTRFTLIKKIFVEKFNIEEFNQWREKLLNVNRYKVIQLVDDALLRTQATVCLIFIHVCNMFTYENIENILKVPRSVETIAVRKNTVHSNICNKCM